MKRKDLKPGDVFSYVHSARLASDALNQKEWWVPNNDDSPPGVEASYYPDLERDVVLRRTTQDIINHPAHYTCGGIEVLDAIDAWGLDKDSYLANAVKYIARAGKKDPTKTLEDLKKAQFYLNRRIAKLEAK